ncbi:AbrB family transcriptional regulator [Oceanobacillus sp. J11TS1]|uniref:AbrB family transcriptional regulator n=1 Tax=Oceanobacillus sp. J11TS1 TaxID=2807191 RepID=UPI001B0CF243|nr:AbrB family transcriptional regulator [Oceanobacillus sp. J11TS1]GIO23378.1 aminopeptidase [Oceanobacillus sp. J11TS1]
MILIFLRTFAIGLLGAIIFSFIGLPIPWLLGSMLMTLLFQLKSSWKIGWHPIFRNIGLVIAGYMIGYAFTLEALQEMVRYFPMMLLINVIFFILFIAVSFAVSKWARLDLGTAMTCCAPGGLQQVVVFAEEQKTLNITVVTFYHVMRLLAIITFVPFIVSSNHSSIAAESPLEKYSWILFGLMILCYGAGIVFQFIKVPTAYLLGPVFFVMICNLLSIPVPVMPENLLHIAQLFIGIYMGLLLKRDKLKKMKSHIVYAIGSCVILIGVAFLISEWMAHHFMDFATSFLSVVPGGVDQMGIIAASIQAEVTVVTSFQLFRILFLSIIIIPFVKYMVHREQRKVRS